MGEIRHVLLARLLSLLVPSVSRAYHEGGQSALFYGMLPTVELLPLGRVAYQLYVSKSDDQMVGRNDKNELAP